MANSDREEAEKIKDFIADLDKHINAMGNKRELDDIYEDTKELRSKLKSSLEYLRTDIRDLRRIDETDFYGTEPALAGQRRRVIMEIEKIKTDIELEVYPKVEKITKDMLIKEDALMPNVAEADKQAITQKTNDLLDGASRAVNFVQKGIKLVAAFKSIFIPIIGMAL
jgi:hypothetical protein